MPRNQVSSVKIYMPQIVVLPLSFHFARLLQNADFARDIEEAHRLAMDLFFGGHLLPLSIMGGSQRQQRSSAATAGRSLQPRPPSVSSQFYRQYLRSSTTSNLIAF